MHPPRRGRAERPTSGAPRPSDRRPGYRHVLVVAAIAAACPARGATTAILDLDGPVSAIRLSLPHGPPPSHLPVVLLLTDGPDDGSRAEPIVDRLLERGIAVVEADIEHGFPDPPDPAGLAAALEASAPGWFAPSGLGVLGLGAGARAALLWPAPVPVAALYPACAGRPARVVATGALVLHADEAAEAEACARLPVRAVPVPGATHAWDHRHGPDEEGTARLPHPDGSATRLFARRYPWAVEFAAERVAEHFAAALLPPHAPLPRLVADPDRDGGR